MQYLTERGQPTYLRVVMLLLGVPSAVTGGWALASPQGWFNDFPGWAPSLVAAYPPFNEHLALDAGAGLFASGLLMTVAAVWNTRDMPSLRALGSWRSPSPMRCGTGSTRRMSWWPRKMQFPPPASFWQSWGQRSCWRGSGDALMGKVK